MNPARHMAVVVGAVVLCACQSGPVPSDFPAQIKTAAAKHAFFRVHQLDALVEQCRSVNENLFKTSLSAHEGWLQRNRTVLAATNAAYMQEVVALQAALGQTKGQLPSFKFLMETNEQITEDLRDRIQTSSDREHACERQLQAFDESGDLLKEPRFGAVFAKFKHDYPEAVMPVKLPDLSANYVPRRNGGRSTYSVEITMKEKNCQPLTVFNLESNWPNEIYAAVCAHDNAETFYVIHCEWQQCKFGPERE